MKENQGWISVHRKIINWEWYDDANTFRLFLHLLLTVNHKAQNWRGEHVEKGSVITSQAKLADKLKLSVMQIRTSLTKLKSTGEITVKTTSRFSYITINKFDAYQRGNRQSNRRITGKVTGEQQADNRRITTNNNENNENNENKRERLHASIKYLEEIPNKDVLHFINKYKCTAKQARSKAEDLSDYCRSHGKKYKNYKALLRNALKKDFGIRPLTTKIPEYVEISEKDRERNIAKMKQLKQKVLGKGKA